MKYKKILFLFGVFLPVAIMLRLVQFSFTIDYSTGFYIKEFESNGEAMFWVLLALIFSPSLFALFSHRSPAHPPKPNIILSLASFSVGSSIIYEMFFETFSAAVMGWQITLIKIAGILSAAFFICYGLKYFISFRLPNICTAIPTVYFILRIICDFTSISALALISENLLLILAYCSVLLFMLQFAKLYNGLDSEYNFRKLLSSGLASIMLCLTQTLPHFILKTLTGYSFMHTSLAGNVNLFFISIFIAVFLFSHFSYYNSCLTEEEQQNKRFSIMEKITKIRNKFK